ncbi:MAG TPA: type II CAAX endopeptidase family protein [Candidatus Deferrimicrobium sp.]|nr:type II CAAX endopeptidase family protein [Candidatus Deferrimicrobium sp.]
MDNLFGGQIKEQMRNVLTFYIVLFGILMSFLVGVRLIEDYILQNPLSTLDHTIISCALYGGLFGFTIYYARKTQISTTEMGFHGLYVPKSLLIGFIATAGYLIAVIAFQMPLSYTPMVGIGYPSVPDILILLGFTMLIGLTEETAFRGYIQANYMQVMSQMKAVLLTGILFALLHVPSYLLSGNFLNLLSLPSLILIGLILGYIRVRTGNIYGVIIAHATWDFYMFLFAAEIPLDAELMDLIPILVASVAMWGTIVLSMLVAKRWIDRPEQIPGELRKEGILKIQSLADQVWRLQQIISMWRMSFIPQIRKIEIYKSRISMNEEIIQIYKEYQPQINKENYKAIQKLLILKSKLLKIEHLIRISSATLRLMELERKKSMFEAEIQKIEHNSELRKVF